MGRLNLLQDLVPSLRRANAATLTLTRQLFGQESISIEALCDMIMASDGEYSSLLIAERILSAYEALDEKQRTGFFEFLTERFDLDLDDLEKRLADYQEEQTPERFAALTSAAESDRQELFRRLNMVPGGTAALVRMREHLLALRKSHPEFRRIDGDLRHLFNSWFNRGFLVMQPIDWTTPAHILEKIIAYEAVHAIPNWRELRQRLEPADRHCFGFFHPAMGDDPLVFVEVALTNSMPSRIGDILSVEREAVDPQRASHAIFYSISSCHRGLSGISFGNFLIKQVAMGLQNQFPQLKQFATLSPAPTFRRWVSDSEQATTQLASSLEQASSHEDLPESGLPELRRLAASYYLEAKTADGEPMDPVARFHLRNGARLEQLNLLADNSDKGWAQSLGLMVNYVYDLGKVEQNHERYVNHQRIAASSAIKKLVG